MLTTREAVRIGRRGGKKRMYSLSPEVRSEIASWAELVRAQRRRGEVTATDQRRRLIGLVRSEDPDLAALLQFLARLPLRLAYHVYEGLPDQDYEFVERKIEEVLCGH